MRCQLCRRRKRVRDEWIVPGRQMAETTKRSGQSCLDKSSPTDASRGPWKPRTTLSAETMIEASRRTQRSAREYHSHHAMRPFVEEPLNPAQAQTVEPPHKQERVRLADDRPAWSEVPPDDRGELARRSSAVSFGLSS